MFLALVEPLTDYLGNIRSESHRLAHYVATTEVSVLWFAAAPRDLLGVCRLGACSPASNTTTSPWLARIPRTCSGHDRRELLRRLAGVPAGIARCSTRGGAVAPRCGAVRFGCDGSPRGMDGGSRSTLHPSPRCVPRWPAPRTLHLLGLQFAAGAEEVSTRGDSPTVLFAFLYGPIAGGSPLARRIRPATVARSWSTHRRRQPSLDATYFSHPLTLHGASWCPSPPFLSDPRSSSPWSPRSPCPVCPPPARATRYPGAARIL